MRVAPWTRVALPDILARIRLRRPAFVHSDNPRRAAELHDRLKMSLYCAGIRFQEYGTSGAIEAPYNGWRPYNGCSGLPGRARRAEKGESMGIEEMLKKGDGVRLGSRNDPQGVLEAGRRRDGRGGSARHRRLRRLRGRRWRRWWRTAARVITFNLEDTIRDLDSATTTDSVSTDVLLNVMSGLYRLDRERQARARHGRERGHKRGPAHLHLHAARRHQVVQRRPRNRQGLRVRLEEGPKPRHRSPVRLHHHHLRQGGRRLQHGQGQRRRRGGDRHGRQDPGGRARRPLAVLARAHRPSSPICPRTRSSWKSRARTTPSARKP